MQDLLVAGHAGVEHDLAEGLALGAEPRRRGTTRAVLQREQRGAVPLTASAFPSATVNEPRSIV